MSDAKRSIPENETQAGIGTETTGNEQTHLRPSTLSLSPSTSRIRRETRSSSLSPSIHKLQLVHKPYRSAGGASTSFISHRRTQQNHYLPAPIPTMSSTEIKRQSKSKLVHSSRNTNSATTVGIKIEEDYDGSISCPSIRIVSNISIPSLSSARIDETEIGEGNDTFKQSPGVYEGDIPKAILQEKEFSNPCSANSLNTVTTAILSCATTEENEKRGSTENSAEEEHELQNALHDEYVDNCVYECIVEDVENCIVRKNSCPLPDEGGFPHDGGGPIDNILLINASTDTPDTHQKGYYETEKGYTHEQTCHLKQSSELHEEDKSRDILIPRTDIISSNTVVIDKPAGITTILASSATASEVNEERTLLESCADEQYQVKKALNSEIDSICVDASGTEGVENCTVSKKTYLHSDEGDFPIVNSDSNRDTPLMNIFGDIYEMETYESKERKKPEILKETNGKVNLHEVDFEIYWDHYKVCQINASPEINNKNHYNSNEKDKCVRDNFGKIEYLVQENPKIDLNNGKNADKSNGLAADTKKSEPLISEVAGGEEGHDLIASANKNILESSAPNGGCTTSPGPKVLKKTVKKAAPVKMSNTSFFVHYSLSGI